MKNKGLIILVVILTLCLCGTTGYIVYDKVMVKSSTDSEEKEGTKAEKKAEVKKLSEDNAWTFMRKIDVLNTFLYEKYPIEDVANLNNTDVLEFGQILLVRELYTSGGITGFSADKLKEVVISYLGYDYPIKFEDIKCFAGDGVLYQYNSTTNEYMKIGDHAHGGPGSGRSKAFFQEGTYDKDADTYVIKTKVLSSDSAGELSGPKSRFYDAFNFNTEIYNTEDDTEYDVVYKEVSDKLSIVTYTFVKNSDGGYGLKSVKLG